MFTLHQFPIQYQAFTFLILKTFNFFPYNNIVNGHSSSQFIVALHEAANNSIKHFAQSSEFLCPTFLVNLLGT